MCVLFVVCCVGCVGGAQSRQTRSAWLQTVDRRNDCQTRDHSTKRGERRETREESMLTFVVCFPIVCLQRY